MAIIRDASGLFAICGMERNSFRSIEPLPSLYIPMHVSYGLMHSGRNQGVCVDRMGDTGSVRRRRKRGHERVEFEEPLLQSLEFGSIDCSVVHRCSDSSDRHRRQRLGDCE